MGDLKEGEGAAPGRVLRRCLKCSTPFEFTPGIGRPPHYCEAHRRGGTAPVKASQSSPERTAEWVEGLAEGEGEGEVATPLDPSNPLLAQSHASRSASRAVERAMEHVTNENHTALAKLSGAKPHKPPVTPKPLRIAPKVEEYKEIEQVKTIVPKVPVERPEETVTLHFSAQIPKDVVFVVDGKAFGLKPGNVGVEMIRVLAIKESLERRTGLPVRIELLPGEYIVGTQIFE